MSTINLDNKTILVTGAVGFMLFLPATLNSQLLFNFGISFPVNVNIFGLMVFIIAANIPTFPSAVFSFVNVLTFSWYKCALLPYSRC